MRKLLLLAFAALLLAPAAQAQADFATFAQEADLATAGTEVNVLGFDRRPDGTFAYFDGENGNLAAYDPETQTNTILRTAANIAVDTGEDINTVDALTTDDEGNIYLVLRDDNSINLIYRAEASGESGTVLATADATNGITVMGETLYIAGNEFNGGDAADAANNLEDGIYSISTTGGPDQTPAEVFINPDLDIGDIGVGASGTIYGTTGRFGETDDLTNTIFAVTDPEGNPSFSVVADPFADGIFEEDGNGDLVDIEVFSRNGSDRIYVYNNSFSSSDGEQIALIIPNGSSSQLIATESDIVSDPDVDATSIGGGSGKSLYFDEQTNNIYFATIDNFGDADEVIEISEQALPVEFDGVPTASVDGDVVTLSWRTLSEENNHGFYAQHKLRGDAPDAWQTTTGRVEGAGTTSEASDYSQRITGLTPGRYVFRVRQVDFDGGDSFSRPVEAEVGLSGFALQPALQNPFRGQTTLTYSAPDGADVEATLYNSLGQQVRRLNATGGQIQVDAGSLASGLYFVRLVSGDGRIETQSITLVR